MNRQKILLMTVVLALVGATAMACVYIKNNRRLGNPGLKLAQQPVYDNHGNIIGQQVVALPEQVLHFQGSTNLPVTVEEVATLPPDTTYGRRIYQTVDQFSLFLSVVLMGVDSRSIHKPEFCLPSQGWKIERREIVTIPITEPGPYDLSVMKIVASKPIKTPEGVATAHCLYLYWFVAENDLTADHAERMRRMTLKLLRTGTLQRWAYVTCLSQFLPGEEEAVFQKMKEFITAAVPQFQLTTGTIPAEVAKK